MGKAIKNEGLPWAGGEREEGKERGKEGWGREEERERSCSGSRQVCVFRIEE